MASVVQTYRLDQRNLQTPVMGYAGCVQGESEGPGPECMKSRILMRLSFGHDNGGMPRRDTVGHGEHASMINLGCKLIVSEPALDFGFPDYRLRADSSSYPTNHWHSHDIVPTDCDYPSRLRFHYR